MGFRDWPSWLKGGVITFVIAIAIIFFNIEYQSSTPLIYIYLFLFIYPTMIIDELLINKCIGKEIHLFPNLIGERFSLTLGFILTFIIILLIGALIGWLIGKIKSKNQTQKLNKNYIKSK